MTWQADAIRRINKVVVEHTAFRDHVRSVVSFLEVPRGPEFLVVTGATQMGKSKIVKASEKRFLAQLKPPPDDIPVIKIVSDNSSSNGFFSTKAFMFSACRAVRHPFFDGKDDDAWGAQLRIPERISESTLRDGFIQGVRHRKTMAIIIDELQQVRHCKGGVPAALRVLDSLKGLALNAGVPVIMIGSYELLELVQQIPHLLSRSTCIHVAPYSVTSEEGQKELGGALRQLIQGCPMGKTSSAERELVEYILPRSLGSVGHLSRWVARAVREAMRVDSPTLSMSHFAASRPGPRDTAKFFDEIRTGRKLLGLDLEEAREPALTVPTRTVAAKRRKAKGFGAKLRRYPVDVRGATEKKP